jgi:RNA polymerase sigma factor for flagellar operon FliA
LAPDDLAARHEAYRRLAGAMAQLPERERALIEAHYGEDLTLDAAGRRLGLSKSWTSRLHARAIDKLARLLEDSEHALREPEGPFPAHRGAK